MVTSALVPLNESAPPYLPDADRVAFEIVPLLPFPDASVTVVPDASSNAYAATSPDDAAVAVWSLGKARSAPAPTALTVKIAAAARTAKRRDIRFAMSKSPLVTVVICGQEAQ